MSDRCSNVISNTSIRDNNDSVEIKQNIKHKIIKFVEAGSLALFVMAISFIE